MRDGSPTRPPTPLPVTVTRIGSPVPLVPGPVEIAVVSPRCGLPVPTVASLRSFVGLCFRGDAARLLLLPGVQDVWPTDARSVMSVASELGAAALFECARGDDAAWVASDRNGAPLGTRIRQTFSTSADVDANPALVDALLVACGPGGERTVSLAGTAVGLLSCGENNLLRNAQRDGNRVSVRHRPRAEVFPGVPIVFNGAHTNMGNWGKLDKRFEFLSRGGRLSLYATNNGAERTSWRSALRAWHDGRKVADGEEVFGGHGVQARLVRDPADRFRALVVIHLQ